MIPPAQPLPDGLVIVFEGIDGVGKSTQLRMAQEALVAASWPVQATRGLGGTPIGEALREVIKSPIERPSESNLYMSLAIQAALLEAIAAQRAQHQLVLMDRGPLSLAAYEIYGGQLSETVGWPYVEAGMAQLRPELTIIYEANTAKAVERARAQSAKADYFESQPLSYFERVANGYQTIGKRYRDQLVVIDADQSLKIVHQQTMEAIVQLLA